MASIIREVLTAFNANKPGTAYFDESIHDLYNAFLVPPARYSVVEQQGKIIGGGGLYPTDGLPAGYCELVKLYLLPEARGKGLGKKLMELCLLNASQAGFTHVYLETLPELKAAIPLYEKMGFSYLPAPLGQSGHYGCSVWMVKAL
jgi:putative acetyltransferase